MTIIYYAVILSGVWTLVRGMFAVINFLEKR